MLDRTLGFLCALFLLAAAAQASSEGPEKTLRVYGPGGPHHVLAECAEIFSDRHGVQVGVIRALPHELDDLVKKDGDIYFGGAPCMLKEFDSRNPGVLDLSSVEHLYPRQVGILVRKGNPLDIRCVDCLSKEEVLLLDVKLENMDRIIGESRSESQNRRHSVFTGKQGVSAWLANPDVDAWVTYRSWHVQLEDESEFIELPGENALRATPVAITRHTRNPEEAVEFIEFLKSAEAYEIFQQHGWD